MANTNCWHLHDFRFDSGETLEALEIHYQPMSELQTHDDRRH